jgi:hypothetical protein
MNGVVAAVFHAGLNREVTAIEAVFAADQLLGGARATAS